MSKTGVITGWSVVVDMGGFDTPLFESEFKTLAKRYRKLLKPHTRAPVKVKVKPTNEVRLIQETFIQEDVPYSIKV